MENGIQCGQCGEIAGGVDEFCSKCGSNLVISAISHENTQPNTDETLSLFKRNGGNFKSGRVLLSAVIFTILGPPIGGLFIFTPSIFENTPHITFDFKAIALVVVFSYIFGIIPALATGLTYGYTIQYYSKVATVIICSATSFISSFVTALLFTKGEFNSLTVAMSVVSLLSCLLISAFYKTPKTT